LKSVVASKCFSVEIFKLGLVMAFQVHEAPLLKAAKKEDIVSKREKD
jgi:hypothetical protein